MENGRRFSYGENEKDWWMGYWIGYFQKDGGGTRYVVPDYYCLCTYIRYEWNQEYRMGGRMMELILRSSSVEWLFCLVWWIIIRNADERKSSNVW